MDSKLSEKMLLVKELIREKMNNENSFLPRPRKLSQQQPTIEKYVQVDQYHSPFQIRNKWKKVLTTDKLLGTQLLVFYSRSNRLTSKQIPPKTNANS